MKDQEQIIIKILEGETELFRLLVHYYHNRIFILTRGFVHVVQDAEDLTQETFINAFVSLGSFKGKSDFSTWLYRIAINTTYSFLRKKSRTFTNAKRENHANENEEEFANEIGSGQIGNRANEIGNHQIINSAKQTANCANEIVDNEQAGRVNRKAQFTNSEMDMREGGSDPFEVVRDKQINELIYREIDRLPTSQRTAFVLSRVEEMSQKEIAKVMNTSVHAVESLLQRAKKRLKIKLTPIIYENRF